MLFLIIFFDSHLSRKLKTAATYCLAFFNSFLHSEWNGKSFRHFLFSSAHHWQSQRNSVWWERCKVPSWWRVWIQHTRRSGNSPWKVQEGRKVCHKVVTKGIFPSVLYVLFLRQLFYHHHHRRHFKEDASFLHESSSSLHNSLSRCFLMCILSAKIHAL